MATPYLTVLLHNPPPYEEQAAQEILDLIAAVIRSLESGVSCPNCNST